MRILHVASFDGNIGDNASHMGFRMLMSNVLPGEFTIERLEIRKFYNNYSLSDKRYFDEGFAKQANQYDLLVIGGGGFLDYDIKNSITGTTISISNQVLDLIKTPIFISSIGCNPRNEIPDGNIDKFRGFLDHFLERKNSFLAVRNDGSKEALRKYIGEDYANAIPQVLDHGFFYENDGSHYIPTNKPYILINTTNDQVKMAKDANGKLDDSLYVNEMGRIVNYVMENTGMNVVFAPHIYSDLGAISDVLKHVNDFYIRTRIGITPYAQSDSGCDQVFSAYKRSSLVLGMRFHANVCSIAMNIPSLAIAALDRVSKMYADFDLSHRVFTIDKPFSAGMIEKISDINGDIFKIEGEPLLADKKAEMIALYKHKFAEIL